MSKVKYAANAIKTKSVIRLPGWALKIKAKMDSKRGKGVCEEYIRCEMTPTSIGGEQQVCISGSSISHLIYAPRGCAGIRTCIMSAEADRIPRQDSERVLNLKLNKKLAATLLQCVPDAIKER